ncbi:MAG: HDOD domain-containing protein [Deferribacteres bacterium]|nr:HDOD domain-containing protein [candidate division KSB1 bacterium]MCB9502827.1 HDOD domain-containing protein [Deferribacteres bacterium]
MTTDHVIEFEKMQSILKDLMIPPRPQVLTGVMEEKNKPDCNTSRIAEIIREDVAISAGVLKTVNSPFFGLRQEILSISQAVVLLGLTNIMNIVSALSLRQLIMKGNEAFMENFWTMSTENALISAKLAKELTQIPPDEAYMLGLLQNCGIPILGQKYPSYNEIYLEALQLQDEKSITEIEEDYYHINHCVVGYVIATRWQFPNLISDCILKHHSIDSSMWSIHQLDEDGKTLAPLLAILKLAEHLSQHYHGLPDFFEWQKNAQEILSYLNVTPKELGNLEKDASECLSNFYKQQSIKVTS